MYPNTFVSMPDLALSDARADQCSRGAAIHNGTTIEVQLGGRDRWFLNGRPISYHAMVKRLSELQPNA
jgi:hypothetical protein